MLVVVLLSGCGNQKDETVAKDTVVKKEEQVNLITPEVYWENVDVYFTDIENAETSIENNSISDLKSIRLDFEKYVDALKDIQGRVVNLNVPNHPAYEGFQEDLVAALPKLIESIEQLVSEFPETNADYVKNPQSLEKNLEYVQYDAMILDTTIQQLKRNRTTIQEELE